MNINHEIVNMLHVMHVDRNVNPQMNHAPIAAVPPWLWIEPATIEKHIKKGHVIHVESNGRGDVNKPDCGD